MKNRHMFDGDTSRRAVGARMQAVRLAMGYVKAAPFARHIGTSAQALNDWEKGRRRPNIDQALDFRRVTGVPLDFLYLGIESALPAGIAFNLRNAAVDNSSG